MRDDIEYDLLQFRSIIDTNGHIAFTYHNQEYLFAYVPNEDGKWMPSLQIGMYGGNMAAWYERPVTLDTSIIDGKSFRQLLENDEISDISLYGNAEWYMDEYFEQKDKKKKKRK